MSQSGLRRNPLLAIYLAIACSQLVASGCGPNVRAVLLECPSPDSKLKAVYWYEGGGGAAGWSAAYLTVVPAAIENPIHERQSVRLSHAHPVQLSWLDHRSLNVGYRESEGDFLKRWGSNMTLLSMPADADGREIALTFRPLSAAESQRVTDDTRCLTGGRARSVGPPRDLPIE